MIKRANVEKLAEKDGRIAIYICVDPQGKVIAEGLRGQSLVEKLGEVLR